MPFAHDFFDAIVSLDSYHYYGTDIGYLEFHILRHLSGEGRLESCRLHIQSKFRCRPQSIQETTGTG